MFEQELNRGDIICIAKYDTIVPAMFIQNTGTSVQYFDLNSDWLANQIVNAKKAKTKLRVDYVNASHKIRFIKINRDILDKFSQDSYDLLKEYFENDGR